MRQEVRSQESKWLGICPSPVRGEILVAQGGAPAEPWVGGPIPSLLPLHAQAGRVVYGILVVLALVPEGGRDRLVSIAGDHVSDTTQR